MHCKAAWSCKIYNLYNYFLINLFKIKLNKKTQKLVKIKPLLNALQSKPHGLGKFIISIIVFNKFI